MEVEELRAYSDLFDSDGWKLVVREATEEIESLKQNALDSTKSFEEVCYLRGQSHQLLRLITLEDTLIAMVSSEQEDNDDADLSV